MKSETKRSLPTMSRGKSSRNAEEIGQCETPHQRAMVSLRASCWPAIREDRRQPPEPLSAGVMPFQIRAHQRIASAAGNRMYDLADD